MKRWLKWWWFDVVVRSDSKLRKWHEIQKKKLKFQVLGFVKQRWEKLEDQLKEREVRRVLDDDLRHAEVRLGGGRWIEIDFEGSASASIHPSLQQTQPSQILQLWIEAGVGYKLVIHFIRSQSSNSFKPILSWLTHLSNQQPTIIQPPDLTTMSGVAFS